MKLSANRPNLHLLLVACSLLFGGAFAGAQTVSGTFFGVVHDPSNALVQGVKIVATNTGTGEIRSTISSGLGTYEIPGLMPGSYAIEASRAGFKSEVRTGVTITVGANVSVNFVLAIGDVTEKVTVAGVAPQIETTNATLGGVVGERAISELPLNGRDWLQLTTLEPGVVGGVGQTPSVGLEAGGRAARGNGVAFSISGGRDTENVFLIDGLVVNDYANAGPGSSLGVNLGVDAIREFSVLTSNYTAENGLSSGGVVSAVLKSGTNDFHGSIFYFHRNSALDARNFFDVAKPPFRRHQFGGSLGGPIKKDKLFFFVNYESLRQLLSISESSDTLSPNARAGILTTGNVTVSPAVQPYLAAFPLPNGVISGDTGKFNFGGANLGIESYVIGKIDYNISKNNSLYGSYSFDNAASTLPDAYNEKLINTPSRRQNFVLSFQHVFSPTLINTSRAGFSRTHAGDALDLSAITPNPTITDPSLGFVAGLPAGIITVPGTTGFSGGLGASGGDIYNYTAPQFSDNLMLDSGRNSLRTGILVDRIDDNVNARNTPNGEWDFGSIPQFLTGDPSGGDFTSDLPGNDSVRGLRQTYIGAYIEDDLRLRPNLTVNLGLRYEFTTVLTEAHNKIANLRNLTDATVTIGNPYFMNPTKRDFQPRIGLAWDPNGSGKTSIRSGFGLFDILPLPYTFANAVTRSVPFAVEGTVNNPPSSSFPSSAVALLTPSSFRTEYVQFKPGRAYTMNWNLNIQRQLTQQLALTVGYVGSSGVHVPVESDDHNQVPPSLVTKNASGQYVFPQTSPPQVVNPNFGRIQSLEWLGKSRYNSLLANLEERLSHGFAFGAAYTWSRSTDEGSATFGSDEYLNGADNPWPFDVSLQRGPSDYDIPHNIVVNYTWTIPFSSPSRMLHASLSGWEVGGIFQSHSGMPFSLTIAGDQANTGTSRNDQQRPNFNPIPGCSRGAVNPGQPFNYVRLECFSFPAFGTLGDLGRNTLRGPWMNDFDFSVFKNQKFFADRLNVQLRAEFFNIFNHTNFQESSAESFDTSGNVIPTAAQITPPTLTTSRQIQVGAKVSW